MESRSPSAASTILEGGGCFGLDVPIYPHGTPAVEPEEKSDEGMDMKLTFANRVHILASAEKYPSTAKKLPLTVTCLVPIPGYGKIPVHIDKERL
jgi:hypothetical protein